MNDIDVDVFTIYEVKANNFSDRDSWLLKLNKHI